MPHWDNDTTRELIAEGWAALSQKKINECIDKIPELLHDLIYLQGQFTGG